MEIPVTSHTFMCQIFAKTILSWDFEQNGQKFGDFIRFGLSRVPLSRPYGLAPLQGPCGAPAGPGAPRGVVLALSPQRCCENGGPIPAEVWGRAFGGEI